jgi:hypothetical protein
VVIDSAFGPDAIPKFHKKKQSQLSEYIREQIGVALQQIPLLGRFAAHATGTLSRLVPEMDRLD